MKDEGISREDIDRITHDYSVWYHNGNSTCVAYGDWNENCSLNEYFCPGGSKIGNATLQSRAIKQAIAHNGVHPMCPLL